MFSNMEELNKAIETVRSTTAKIYEHLRLSHPEKDPEANAPEQRPTLIGERIKYLGNFRSNLYYINSCLEEILTAVEEI